MELKEPEIFTLENGENGIRVVHQETTSSDVSHLGLMVNVGRDEDENEKGLAHFIEHVLFKGTTKRKAYHILNRLENVGGELNAYTTKEETCIHASVLNEYYERGLDLVSDITFHSTFPEKEIEKEKEVIIDEIKSCLDNPSEQIYDDFEEQIYKGHPLSNPILGTETTIKAFKTADIKAFINKNYHTDQIVLSSVGSMGIEQVKKLAERYLGDVPERVGRHVREKYKGYRPEHKTEKKSNSQAHCIIGNVAYSYNNNKRIGLVLLNNLLGGPGMNSRLNLNIREKHGIAYNIYSCYTNYSDTGVFSIYLGTDPENIEKSKMLTYKELKKLRDQKLGGIQLKQAKQQLIGQIAMAQESKLGLMQVFAKSMLNYNRIETLPEIYAKINKLNAEELLDISNEIFDESSLSTLVYTI